VAPETKKREEGEEGEDKEEDDDGNGDGDFCFLDGEDEEESLLELRSSSSSVESSPVDESPDEVSSSDRWPAMCLEKMEAICFSCSSSS